MTFSIVPFKLGGLSHEGSLPNGVFSSNSLSSANLMNLLSSQSQNKGFPLTQLKNKNRVQMKDNIDGLMCL
jgi:hypothetical protein